MFGRSWLLDVAVVTVEKFPRQARPLDVSHTSSWTTMMEMVIVMVMMMMMITTTTTMTTTSDHNRYWHSLVTVGDVRRLACWHG
jgi:hypothetical protein